MNHEITITQLGRHEYRPGCSCGWTGQIWRTSGAAAAEFGAHIPATAQKEYA